MFRGGGYLFLFNVRRQRVQRYIRRVLPSISTLTRWMLGLNCLLVARFEWLTLCPNWGPLPHISHFAI